MEQLDTKPWYQQFWPWALMSLPATAVVAGIITIIIAVKTDDGLVSDDYYKEGLAYNQSSARDERAVELGLIADIMINSDNQSVLVRMKEAIAEDVLLLNMVHSTIAGLDQTEIALEKTADGSYQGKLHRLSAGKWRVELTSKEKDWRMTGIMGSENLSLRLPMKQ